MQITITKSKFKLCHLLSLCIALTLFQACDVDDIVGLNYDEVEQYGSFFGDPHYPTVIVHSQGSNPAIKLFDSKLIKLLEDVNTNKLIIANVGQRQVNDIRTITERALTASEAETVNDQSVDDLATVIRHFKEQGKNVYVLGAGFGGYLTQELIARYGTEIADKYLVMGSRLDVVSDLSAAWASGKNAFVDHNSTPASVISTNETSILNSNLNRLFGAIASENYIEKLEGQDLSKLTYVHSSLDEVVGNLENDEQSFLSANNANLIVTNGNHNSGISSSIVRSMKEGFGIE